MDNGLRNRVIAPDLDDRALLALARESANHAPAPDSAPAHIPTPRELERQYVRRKSEEIRRLFESYGLPNPRWNTLDEVD